MIISYVYVFLRFNEKKRGWSDGLYVIGDQNLSSFVSFNSSIKFTQYSNWQVSNLIFLMYTYIFIHPFNSPPIPTLITHLDFRTVAYLSSPSLSLYLFTKKLHHAFSLSYWYMFSRYSFLLCIQVEGHLNVQLRRGFFFEILYIDICQVQLERIQMDKFKRENK
jgi:purine-cytosine permease-like protein